MPIVNATNGLTKADGGLLTIGVQQLYTGTTTVNGGTLQTAVPNAIYVPYTTAASPGNIAAAVSGQALQLNLGGTFDLAGNNESFNVLNSAVTTVPGIGGTVMNSGATANFRVAPNANEVFAGSIAGPINFIRDGNNTLTLSYSSNYTGTTTLNGGVTTLQDYGALTNTSEIYVRRAVLRWDDNTGVTALSTRLPSGINIWFDGGAFVFNARNGTNTVQTINDNLVFNSGNSEIDPIANAGTVQLTLSSYSVATGATVTFGGNGVLVNANDDDNVGGSARVYFTNPPTMINGIIPWATTFGYDPTLTSSVNANFATYDPSLGVKPTAAGGVQVSGAVSFAGSGNVNVQPSGNVTLPGGGATMNSLYFHATSTLSFTNSTDTLYVQAGAILGDSNGNTARQIGQTPGFGNLTVGNPGTSGTAQFYISNASNTLTINANIVDNVPGGSAPATLVFGAADVAAGVITLAGSNSYSGATYVNGVVLNLNSPAGALAIPSANLIINGGNNNGADSLPVANASVTLLASNQINPAANVLINGQAQLNLNSFSNTIANLTINNDGGSQGANGPLVYTGTGQLTLAGTLSVGTGTSDGGTTTNATNSFNVPTINGQIAFAPASGPGIVNVAPVSSAPAQVGLGLNAVISVAGSAGLNLTGSGVISIGGQSGNFGTVNVAPGTTLALGASGGGNYGAIIGGQVFLPSGATFDARGYTGTVGSIAGSGTLTNFATAAATLYTGLDNTNSTFSGTITNPFAGDLLSLTKIGSGNFNFSANNLGTGLINPNLGTLTVNQGGVTLNSGTAQLGFGTYTLNTGGGLTLDNSVTAMNNRLGGVYELASPTVATPTTTARTLNFQGGTLTINGNLNANGGSALSESMGTVTISGGGVLSLSATNTGGINLSILAIPNQGQNNSLFIQGLPSSGTAAGAGVAAVTVGTITFNNGGTNNTNGSVTMQDRTDIIAEDTNGNYGFLTKDSVTGLLRPLNGIVNNGAGNGGELQALIGTAGTLAAVGNTTNAVVAAGVSGAMTANVTPATLTIQSGGSVSNGLLPGSPFVAGGLLALNMNNGGVLALTGTSSISVGQMTNGNTYDFDVLTGATLTVNATVNLQNAFVKAEGGTLVLNGPYYEYDGGNGNKTIAVNGGVLQLGAGLGTNALWVQPTATVPYAMNLSMGNGTLDLNGNSQLLNYISNSNPLPYAGGTAANPLVAITNSSATPVNLISATGTGETFGGLISGPISFYRAGTATTVLTSSNTYTGTTWVQGGGLTLRDQGGIAATSAVNVNYATLTWDNTGLAASSNRLGSVPLNMNGTVLTILARMGNDSVSLNSLNLLQGNETLNANLYNANAQTGALAVTVGTLNQSGGATINFVPSAGTLGQPGDNAQVFITANPPLTNGIIGGWAIVNGADFASYSATQGVGAVGTAGLSGTYSANLLTAGVPTDNISMAVSTTAGGVTTRTINSLKIGTAATATLNDLNQMLTIGTGGLLTTVNATVDGGQLTAGTAANTLYAYQNANTLTLDSSIVNNAAGAVNFVKSGAGTLTMTPSSALVAAAYATSAGSITLSGTGTTSGLFVGEVLSGTGLGGGTVSIASISGGTIGLMGVTSGSAAANGVITFAAPSLTTSTTQGSYTAVVSTTAALAQGMAVGGVGIPAGTTITGATLNSGTYSLTLSNSAAFTASNALTFGAPSNSYSGSTIVNQGTLNLTGQLGSVVVPGNLTIQGNGTVTENTNAGQIAPTSNVQINGSGTLNLTGSNNALASVTFNDNGGTGTPTVAVGTALNVTASNAITSNNDNTAATPTISGTSLVLASSTGQATIQTSGLSPDDLIISSQITAPGNTIVKTGTGSLVLPNANAAILYWTLNNGALILGNSASLGAAGSTLTISGSGTLMGTAGTPVVATSVYFSPGGSLNFGGVPGTATNALTLSGPIGLSGAAPTISVGATTMTDTITGVISGAGGFTKGGPGTLTLTPGAADQFTGPVTISGGMLTMGNANAITAAQAIDVTVGAAGALNIGGNATTIDSLSGSGVVIGTSTLTIGTSAASNTTFSGAIASSLTLTKTGATNAQTLSGPAVYTGTTNDSAGTLTFSGSATSLTGTINVGNVAATAATLNIQAGNYPLGANSMYVGLTSASATGTVNQSGGDVSFTGGSALLIGNGATGIYNMSGGTISGFASTTRGVMLGVNANSTDAFNMSGGSLAMGSSLVEIGRSDTSGNNNTTNLFSQTGGNVSAGTLTLGGATGGNTGVSATMSLTGGVFTAAAFGSLSAGNTNSSTIIIGGSANVTLPAFPTARGTSSTATVYFNGGTLSPAAASLAYMGSLTNAFIQTGGANFNVPSGDNITISQNLLTDPVYTGGGLALSGTGTLTLTGSNTYTGGTTVSGGMLQMGNSASLGASSGSMTVISGGTLDLHGYNPTVGALTGNATGVIGNLNGSTTGTLTTNTTGNTTFAGRILDTGGMTSLVKTGTGSLALTGVSSNYTGTTSINEGTLSIASIGISNSASSLGNPNASSGTINMGLTGPATLQVVGTNSGMSTTRMINLQGNAVTLDASEGTNSGGNNFFLKGSPNSIVGTSSNLTLTGTSGTAYDDYGGQIHTPMSLDTGSVTKNGIGAWQLDASNSYTGGTTVNGGLLLSATTGALGTGPVNVTGGTLDVSTGSQRLGALTVGSLGTLNLSLNNTLTSTGSASLNGTLDLLNSTSGTEDLMNYTSYSGSFSSTPNVPAGFKLSYTPTALDLVYSTTATTYSLAATATNLNMHVGAANTITATITNTGGNLADTLNFTGLSLSNSGLLAAGFGPQSGGPLALGSGSSNSGTFTPVTAGSYTFTPSVASAANATIGNTGGAPILQGTPTTAMVNVYNLASGSLASTSVNLGTVHVNDTPPTEPLSVLNNAPATYSEKLDASISASSGINATGSISLLPAGSTDNSSLVVGLNTASAGIINGTATITLNSNGTGTSGLAPTTLAPKTVNVSGNVFSGNGHWTGGNGSSTSWGTRTATSNWTDENGVAAAPGTWSYNDTATFDDTAGTNTTITLDGASPTLSVLTFNTTAGGSYSLQQGSGGTLNLNNGPSAAATVNVLSGTHSICAPIELSSSASFNLVSSTVGTPMLTVSGNISDGGASLPLSLTGDGTGSLILAGTGNSYSGGTYVDDGTLIVNNTGAIQDGSALIVGAGGMFLYDPTAGGAANVPAINEKASERSLAPVPEPGTLALLSVAGIVAAAAVWRRRRNRGN